MAFPPLSSSSSSLPPQLSQRDDIVVYHDRNFAINGEILMLILVLFFSVFLLFLVFIVWIRRDPGPPELGSPEMPPTVDFPVHMFKGDQTKHTGRTQQPV